MQGLFCVCAEPMSDCVSVKRHLSLAGCIHKKIPEYLHVIRIFIGTKDCNVRKIEWYCTCCISVGCKKLSNWVVHTCCSAQITGSGIIMVMFFKYKYKTECVLKRKWHWITVNIVNHVSMLVQRGIIPFLIIWSYISFALAIGLSVSIVGILMLYFRHCLYILYSDV